MLKLIAPYKNIILAILSLALLGGVFYWGYSTSNDKWSTKWLQRNADDLQADLNFAADQGRIEKERQRHVDEIQKNAEMENRRLAANAARARAESDRLQRSIETAIQQLRSSNDTAIIGSGQNAGAVGVLLSELYGEINRRSNELAGEADAYYLAGLTCNREWEAVRGVK